MNNRTILLVPDYFWSADPDIFAEIKASLKKMGMKLVVFPHARTLDESISGIENYCRNNDVDLVIAHLTGCHFIASLSSFPRLFVDPDWTPLDEAYGTGSNQGKLRNYEVSDRELWTAQEMSRVEAVTRGRLAAKCLVTGGYVEETDSVIEQLRRFHEVVYDPYLSFPSGNLPLEFIKSLMSESTD